MGNGDAVDAASAARMLLARMVLVEVANEAMRGENAQMLGGLFGQVVADRLALQVRDRG